MIFWRYLIFMFFLGISNLVWSATESDDEVPEQPSIRFIIGGDLEELISEGANPVLSFREYVESNCQEDRNGELVGEGQFLTYKISNFLESYSPGCEIIVRGGVRPGFDTSKQFIGVSHLDLMVIKEGSYTSLIENAFAKWPLNTDFYGVSTIRFILQKEPYSGSWGVFIELVKFLETGEEVTFHQLRGPL
jgi:hypothetical protein